MGAAARRRKARGWLLRHAFVEDLTGPVGAGALLPSYFMLTASSPAIDAADPSMPVDGDFFGTLLATEPDVGAHER